MRLVNAICTRGPLLPDRLKNRIRMMTTCNMTDEEISIFNTALIALDIALASDISAPAALPLTVIFTDSDTVSFTISCPETWGLECNLAVYPLHRWREQHLAALPMLLAALEELCHHFWAIEDEILVKDKVTQLVHLVCPGLKKNDLYNPDW